MQNKRLEALRVLTEHGIIEEYELPAKLADDERFMLLVIGKNSACIPWIGKKLFKNKEFIQMVLVIYEEWWRIEFEMPTEIPDNSDEFDPFFDVAKSDAIPSKETPRYAKFIYKNIPDDLKADPIIIGALVKRKLKITELHKTLSSNSDFLIKAVKDDASVFQLADNSLQNDVDFVRLAVKTNPTVWTLLSDEQKSDPDMQEALGDIKTYILNDIDLGDRDELDRYCQLIPDEVRNDKEFADLAVNRHYYYFKYLSESLKDDLEVAHSAYVGIEGFGLGEEEIFKNSSLRIKSILEKSNLEPVETLTKAIESEKLYGKLGIALKVKDEVKLTPRQKKQQSGPVL